DLGSKNEKIGLEESVDDLFTRQIQSQHGLCRWLLIGNGRGSFRRSAISLRQRNVGKPGHSGSLRRRLGKEPVQHPPHTNLTEQLNALSYRVRICEALEESTESVETEASRRRPVAIEDQGRPPAPGVDQRKSLCDAFVSLRADRRADRQENQVARRD